MTRPWFFDPFTAVKRKEPVATNRGRLAMADEPSIEERLEHIEGQLRSFWKLFETMARTLDDALWDSLPPVETVETGKTRPTSDGAAGKRVVYVAPRS
jgi:hypothetical protein